MAWTTPRTWVASEVPTAALLNAHVRDNENILKTSIADDGTLAGLLSGRVTSDYTNATTTLSDVTGLSFAIGASEIWTFVVFLHILSPTAADIKYGLTVPSGATGRYGVIGPRNEIIPGDAAIGTAISYQTIDSSDMAMVLHGTVVNSTTAGTVQLQAAQDANSGTTTVYANSSIVAVKIG